MPDHFSEYFDVHDAVLSRDHAMARPIDANALLPLPEAGLLVGGGVRVRPAVPVGVSDGDLLY